MTQLHVAATGPSGTGARALPSDPLSSGGPSFDGPSFSGLTFGRPDAPFADPARFDAAAAGRRVAALGMADPAAGRALMRALGPDLSPSQLNAVVEASRGDAVRQGTPLAQASLTPPERIDPFKEITNVRIDVGAPEYEGSLGQSVEFKNVGVNVGLLYSSGGTLKGSIEVELGSLGREATRDTVVSVIEGLTGRPVDKASITALFEQAKGLPTSVGGEIGSSIEFQVDLGQFTKNALVNLTEAWQRVDYLDPDGDPSTPPDNTDKLTQAIADLGVALLPQERKPVAIQIGPKISLSASATGAVDTRTGTSAAEASRGVAAYVFYQGELGTDGRASVDTTNGLASPIGIELSSGAQASFLGVNGGLAKSYTLSFSPGRGVYSSGEQIRDLSALTGRLQEGWRIPGQSGPTEFSSDAAAALTLPILRATAAVVAPGINDAPDATIYGIPRRAGREIVLDVGERVRASTGPAGTPNSVFVDPDNTRLPDLKDSRDARYFAGRRDGVTDEGFTDIYGVGGVLPGIVSTRGGEREVISLEPGEWQAVRVQDENGIPSVGFFGHVVDTDGQVRGALWNGVPGDSPVFAPEEGFLADARLTGAFVPPPPPGTGMEPHLRNVLGQGGAAVRDAETWTGAAMRTERGTTGDRVVLENVPAFNDAPTEVVPERSTWERFLEAIGLR